MKKDEMTPKDDGQELRASRRRLLTALTAGGAAAAFVPGQWSKPIVQGAILPAHAQSTPIDPPGGGGGGGDCTIPSAAFASSGDSMCACIQSLAPDTCGGSAQVTIISAGSTVGSCFTNAASSGGGASWSCSVDGSNPGVGAGATVTFVVEWENGCTCQVTRSAI